MVFLVVPGAQTQRVLKSTSVGRNRVLKEVGGTALSTFCPCDLRFLTRVDRQLRLKRPLVGGPRFAAGEIGGQVRKFIHDAR